MEKHKLVNRLQENYGISSEEAENALEKSGWNMLDAVLFLEEDGLIRKPDVSIFYTSSDDGSSCIRNEIVSSNKKKKDKEYRNGKKIEGIFEAICRVIDRGNNIFLRIDRKEEFILKLPITAVIILLVFTFWIVIPVMIIGLFFDIRYSLHSKQTNVERANSFLDSAAKEADKIKNALKKGVKHD